MRRGEKKVCKEIHKKVLKDLRCRAARDSEVFQFKENLLQHVKYKRSHLHRSLLFLRGFCTQERPKTVRLILHTVLLCIYMIISIEYGLLWLCFKGDLQY